MRDVLCQLNALTVLRVCEKTKDVVQVRAILKTLLIILSFNSDELALVANAGSLKAYNRSNLPGS